MKNKIVNSKVVQSDAVQKFIALVRSLSNVVVILGTAGLSAYLIMKYQDSVILILGAALAAMSLYNLVQVCYLAELKVVKR